MEVHLNAIGVLLIILAMIHGIFPTYFKWTTELAPISLINRQMMYVHTFFIALVLLLMGILCLTSAKQIIETQLGHKLALGMGIFWAFRLAIQLFGYSSKLWRGKRFETTIHVLFLILWSYMSVVFFSLYWS